ncbi:MAG: dihydroorotate dehydrogenase electron transfer subunit, partial [Nitrospinota bacterium]
REFVTGYVLSSKRVKKNYHRIRLHAPVIAKKAKTGQFGMIQVNNLYDPLLKRPMSFHSIDRSNGNVDFLFQVVGRGTELISGFKNGHEISVVGPMGNGFKIKKKKRIIIAAGGIGVSPLFSLVDTLIHDTGVAPETVSIYMGGRSRNDILCAPEFNKMRIDTIITTDDGSRGQKGLVTEPLQDALEKLEKPSSAIIYTCGPHPMLNAVSRLASKYSVECQVSMENMMACGTGACLGCVVETKSDFSDEYGYKTVCKDGPVFSSAKLRW